MSGNTAPPRSMPTTDGTNSPPMAFDLRLLALEKLKTASTGEFITYKDARCVLGRSLHMEKNKSRLLLFSMSDAGMIKLDMRGRIFFCDSSCAHVAWIWSSDKRVCQDCGRNIDESSPKPNASPDSHADNGVNKHG